MAFDRGALLSDTTLTGAAWCQAYSALVDAWLADLFRMAAPAPDRGYALVAVGGYGRSELCPGSDIDVMLVHDGSDVAAVATVADRVWYPIWDQGVHLGHSVFTIRDALQLAGDDLDTATALLSARHLAGDTDLTARLGGAARAQWQRRGKRWLGELADSVELRHTRAGEVAFRLEPDLKEGRGGLRDVHALGWAEAAHRVLLEFDATDIARSYAVILDARVELQRLTGRPTNVLALQDQDAVAAALESGGSDALMARIAQAARTIAWTSDDAWRRTRSALRTPFSRLTGRRRVLEAGISIGDGEVELTPESAAAGDALLPLRTALAAATHNAAIERGTLERLARERRAMPDPWPSEARRLFAQLLLAGPPAIRVIEALDQRGVWAGLLPEWTAVRARPQHNAYHRFTVDRHLLETAANAARLADRVSRPDLLAVAALLHDLGKGYPGDHTEAGVQLVLAIGARMGYPEADLATLAALVQHHLLLPDVATRRDLADVATIERVAGAAGSVERLQLLAALTEADAVATGPSAWSPWKAELIRELVQRATQLLESGDPDHLTPEPFPTRDQLALLREGGRRIDARGDVLTVMTDDRPAIFSRVAGVLALHGLDVLAAAAHSTDDGRALSVFRIFDPLRDTPPWPRVVTDLELALDGRLALPARIAERARLYARTARRTRRPVDVAVHFDNDASDEATVMDVHAPDSIGVLYRITRALADLDLDIHSARVQTLGAAVVDAFYLRDRFGKKVTDQHNLHEIERAVVHCLAPDSGSAQ